MSLITNEPAIARVGFWRVGSLEGLRFWLAYGVAEFAIGTAIPWLQQRSVNSAELQPETTAALMATYTGAGIALGAAAAAGWSAAARRHALLAKLPEDDVRPTLGALALLPALACLQLSIRPWVAAALPLATSALALLFVPIGLGLIRPLGVRLRPFGPWALVLLLIAVPFTSKGLLSGADSLTKLAAVAALVCAIVASTALRKRFEARTPRGAMLLVGLAIAVIGFAYAFNGSPDVSAPVANDAKTARPHVLLVSLDTVRADHLSLYGYARDTTPRLRDLAKESIVFQRAISASDMTLSSHASMFTGVYPSWHGAHFSDDAPHGEPVSRAYPTLAEILASEGYLTAAVVANRAYLQPVYGLSRGFHYYHLRAPFLPKAPDYTARQGLRRALKPVLAPFVGTVYRRASDVNRDVFRVLERAQGSERPLFLFVNYMDAHWPLEPPSPYDEAFPGKDDSFDQADFDSLSVAIMRLERPITERERAHLESQYDGAIAYLDSQVGALIDRLKAMSLYENTLIIITSDHGEVFGERNLFGHGVSVYQDQVHVPLLVKRPRRHEPESRSEVVSGVDLLPTILDEIDVPMRSPLQGVSLLERHRSGSVLAESFASKFLRDLHPRFERDERALFSLNHKLILSTAGSQELYALAEDPNEVRDLASSEAGQLIALKEKLQAVLAERDQPTRSPGFELSPAEMEHLRALGYVAPAD